MDATEIELTVNGLRIAALTYGSADASKRVLALHGWMDNAATFHYVAPALASAGAHVVCPDLPGHGRSGHRPPSAYYNVLDYAATAWELLMALGWADGEVHLLGHSLGGGLCSILAASFPDKIASLMLIESLGPTSRPAQDLPKHFAKAVTAKAALIKHDGTVYPSVAAAVEQRRLTVTKYAGAQSLSESGARLLVERAVEPVHAEAAAEASPEAGVRFRHDRRIIATSLSHFSEEQVRAALASISCRALLISGETGWPVPAEVLEGRLAAVKAPLKRVRLPGSHHLHLDPETQAAAVDAIRAFFAEL